MRTQDTALHFTGVLNERSAPPTGALRNYSLIYTQSTLNLSTKCHLFIISEIITVTITKMKMNCAIVTPAD